MHRSSQKKIRRTENPEQHILTVVSVVPGQRIRITYGTETISVVLETEGSRVKLGFQASPSVSILRQELLT